VNRGRSVAAATLTAPDNLIRHSGDRHHRLPRPAPPRAEYAALIQPTGFRTTGAGDVHPFLTYLRAQRPAPVQRGTRRDAQTVTRGASAIRPPYGGRPGAGHSPTLTRWLAPTGAGMPAA
jgi:hypothetical protein